VRGAQNDMDGLEDSINVCQNFVVSKSVHSISLRLKKLSATGIGLYLYGMLSSVEFYNEPTFRTAKVHDKRANEMLTAELYIGNLPVSVWSLRSRRLLPKGARGGF